MSFCVLSGLGTCRSSPFVDVKEALFAKVGVLFLNGQYIFIVVVSDQNEAVDDEEH